MGSLPETETWLNSINYGCRCCLLLLRCCPCLVAGVDIMQNAKQWNDTTLNEWRNKIAKMLVFRKIAKWRAMTTDAPWLMAMLVVTDLRRCLPKIAWTTCCWRQKHRRRWSGNPKNPKGQMKFCNYREVIQNLCLQHHDSCSNSILLTTKHCRRWWGNTRIKQNSATNAKFFKIYI